MKNLNSIAKTLSLATIITLGSCNGYNNTNDGVKKNTKENIEVLLDRKEVIDDKTHTELQLLEESEFIVLPDGNGRGGIVIKVIKGMDFQDGTIELSETIGDVWKDVTYNFNKRTFSGSYNEKGKGGRSMTNEECLLFIKEFLEQSRIIYSDEVY